MTKEELIEHFKRLGLMPHQIEAHLKNFKEKPTSKRCRVVPEPLPELDLPEPDESGLFADVA